jgi:Tic22-like family
MATPPIEIEKAETDMRSGGPKMYRLIPSKTALQQARELDMDLGTNDIPLFVADRLAFASPKGPQLPLFVDKSDCTLSYQRLRQGRSSLPEQPTIRTTSLLDTLDSMERGTRPGARQLAFYATAEDLAKAADLSVP